jgi:hypothetical protein
MSWEEVVKGAGDGESPIEGCRMRSVVGEAVYVVGEDSWRGESGGGERIEERGGGWGGGERSMACCSVLGGQHGMCITRNRNRATRRGRNTCKTRGREKIIRVEGRSRTSGGNGRVVESVSGGGRGGEEQEEEKL